MNSVTLENNTLSFYLHPSKNPGKTEEKVNRLFNKLIKESCFSIDFPEEKENKYIESQIRELLETRVGRHLFKRLLKAEYKIKIVKGPPSFIPDSNTIQLNISEKIRVLCINKEGRHYLEEIPQKIVLAHELCHALLEAENFDNRLSLMSSQDPEMDNLNEQWTISGAVPSLCTRTAKLAKLNDNFFSLAPICENTFRLALGLDIRVNHRVIKGDEVTLTDLASMGAELDLEKNNLSTMNQPNNAHIKQIKKIFPESYIPQITPLNAAIFAGKKATINFLIKKGANPTIIDDFGSPLHAALYGNASQSLFKELVKMGFDVEAKDKDGNSLLMLAIKQNQSVISSLILESFNPDLDLTNKLGESALSFAVKAGNSTIVKTLVGKGVKIPKELEKQVQKLTEKTEFVL